jgi:uncharacterized protein (TIGR03118 family)
MTASRDPSLAWRPFVVLAVAALVLASPVVIAGVNGTPASVVVEPGGRPDVWQEDLVSDMPGLAKYQFDETVNPMGIERGPLGFVIVANNGTGCLSVHQASGLPVLSPNKPLMVDIPRSAANKGHGLPSSVIANQYDAFDVRSGDESGRSLALVATMDGLIVGWNPYVEKLRAIVVVDRSLQDAAYFGLDVAMGDAGPVLAAADFFNGQVDLFDANFKLIGKLVDADMPEGFAPINVRAFQGKFFVVYAKRASEKSLEIEKGPGLGFIDVFSTDGTLERRLVSGGPLNAPWAIVFAPEQMHDMAGMLLVGNAGDGTINAFDVRTGFFYRPLADETGRPVVIDGLCGLTIHTGFVHGGDASLYFTRSLDGGLHGLFGRLEPVKR